MIFLFSLMSSIINSLLLSSKISFCLFCENGSGPLFFFPIVSRGHQKKWQERRILFLGTRVLVQIVPPMCVSSQHLASVVNSVSSVSGYLPCTLHFQCLTASSKHSQKLRGSPQVGFLMETPPNYILEDEFPVLSGGQACKFCQHKDGVLSEFSDSWLSTFQQVDFCLGQWRHIASALISAPLISTTISGYSLYLLFLYLEFYLFSLDN